AVFLSLRHLDERLTIGIRDSGAISTGTGGRRFWKERGRVGYTLQSHGTSANRKSVQSPGGPDPADDLRSHLRRGADELRGDREAAGSDTGDGVASFEIFER